MYAGVYISDGSPGGMLDEYIFSLLIPWERHSVEISANMPEVRRIAQIVHLKPSAVEAYKECHANVWPEVLKQIHDSNIRDCT